MLQNNNNNYKTFWSLTLTTQHRRSQGVQGGQESPKFLAYAFILCFETLYPKQNSAIRLKSNILPPQQILGLATPLQRNTCTA